MTEWHKWDDEKPPRRGTYLVTLCINDGEPYVISANFDPADQKPWGYFFEGTKVLAWADLPEPYCETTDEWHKFPEEMPPEDVLMIVKLKSNYLAFAKFHTYLEGHSWCYQDGGAWPEALSEDVRFFRKFKQ